MQSTRKDREALKATHSYAQPGKAIWKAKKIMNPRGGLSKISTVPRRMVPDTIKAIGVYGQDILSEDQRYKLETWISVPKHQ